MLYYDNKFERSISNIKCYQHYKTVTHVNLQTICPYGTRILCEECEKTDEVITVKHLQKLCEQFQEQIRKEQNPQVYQVRNYFSNILQQINDVVQILTSKISDALCIFPQTMIDEVDFIMLGPYQYGLKNFEKLAQAVSENVECFANHYNLINYEVSEFNIMRANDYCQIAQNLLNIMTDFLISQSLMELKNQDELNSKFSKKLITDTEQFIADVQLNFDQTIIGAKYAENVNILKFWKISKFDKWSLWTELKCYQENFVQFKFSKFCNQFITCGADEKQPTIGKKYFSSIKLWGLKNDQWVLEAQIHQSQARLQCLTFNNSENLIAAGAGGTVVILEKIDKQFTHQQNRQKSNEMITCMGFNCYDTLLAVGSCDQKVTIYNYNNRKLNPFQTIKLTQTPKQMLFSNVQTELYICSRDGVVNVFKHESEQFIQIQRIINYKGKIRTFGVSKDSRILGIGSECNTIQLFQKQKDDWQCFEEITQEDYVESLAFGNYKRLIISTSNQDLYIHQNYY